MNDHLHNKAAMKNTGIRAHIKVNKIEPLLTEKGTSFQMILSNERTIFTKNILSTTAPQELLKMLGEHTPPAMKDFLSQITPVNQRPLTQYPVSE